MVPSVFALIAASASISASAPSSYPAQAQATSIVMYPTLKPTNETYTQREGRSFTQTRPSR